MNKNILGSTAVLALAFSAAAWADHDKHDGYHDRGRGPGRDNNGGYARVVDVDPVFEHVRYTVPVQNCWVETQQVGYSRANSTGATIVGGAVGALIGNSIGHGDGRAVATVGGAVAGAVVGNQLARNSRPVARYEEVQRCRTVREERFERRVAAYRVTYLYSGRRVVTRLAQDPGRFVRVDFNGRAFG
ncbi:MAG TPA: glycine zipper 2TM domain-containing protein [Steroidobacteraceae bacterium]|nr:glycine zipper 2TM domain-containing protein [Steroidobacteraceae bacterium]